MRRPSGGLRPGGRAGAGLPVLGALAIAGAAACGGPRTSEVHMYFEAPPTARVDTVLRQDTTIRDESLALFRAAVLFAQPDSPNRDLERATEMLEAYLALRPEGEMTEEARSLLDLLDELRQLGGRLTSLQEQLDRLKAIDLERTLPDTAGAGSSGPP